MKGYRWIATLAVAGLTAAAVASAHMPQASTRARAAAAYRQHLLAGPNGRFDGHLYQATLRARARMLAHSAAQTRSWLPGGATTRATAPSVINWTEIGPGNVGGRINAIWIDPTNSQHLLVGAAGGGLWQSSDGGSSWTAVAEFPGSLAVGAIAQLPSGTLLAGTGDPFNEFQPGSGMLMSADNGNTWTPISSTAPASSFDFWSQIRSITTSPTGTAVAATRQGVARSTDGGNTWSTVFSTDAFDVAFDPNNPGSVVAGTYNGTVAYSANGGATWSLATGLPVQTSNGYRVSVAFDPSVAGSVYALVDNNGAKSPSGEVFHSTDGGKTWTLLAATGAFVNAVSKTAVGALCDNSFSGSPVECQGDYDNAIIVLPHAAGTQPTIDVGGIDIFSSTDGGSTWSMVGAAYSNTNYLHADQHAFAYNASSSTLYVGNDGGFYRQLPLGNWLRQNSGLAVTQFYGISGHQGVTASKNVIGGSPITPILAGAQDNGTQLYEGYSSGGSPQPGNWIAIYSGNGGQTQVDPVDGNYLYGEYTNLTLFYSSTGSTAQNFLTEPPDTASQSANFIAPLALVPNGSSAANQMLGGGASLWLGSGIQSGAPTWTSLNGSTLPVAPNGAFISAIGVDPSSNNNLWVGFDDGEIWHTTNATASGGPTWVHAGSGVLPSNQVNSFWVQPGQPTTVYATFAGFNNTDDNVFVSTDGGQTWKGVGIGLPTGPVYSLVTNPAYPQILYVGALTGVYTSIDGGQTWTASSQGPANISVNQLGWFDTSNPQAPILLAATDGRGAWMGSPAYNPTPTLTSISPAQLTLGAPATIVTLNGMGYVGGSTTTLDGAMIATTYVSSTQLQVTVPSTTLAMAGTHTFIVSNPIPGGGASAGASLTVAYPTPTVTSLSPGSAAMGAAGFALSVNGSGFQPVSTVQWNGSALTTTYVSGTTLTAAVPASDLASGGNATVAVTTPAPGGGSASTTFAVNYPMPTLSSISPTSAQGGSSSATITATGGNFVQSSTIDWNGAPLSTRFVSATQLTATVPMGDLAAATNAAVTVVTPAPGGGTSSAIAFTVSAPPAPPAPAGGGGGGTLGAADLLLLVGLYLLNLRRRRSRRAA